MVEAIETSVEQKIGRMAFHVSNGSMDPRLVNLYHERSACITDELARALSFKFMNNTEASSVKSFGRNRPLSAYYFLLKDEVYVDYGLVGPDGNAKLHEFMREDPIYKQRQREGVLTRSGHIGVVRLPGMDQEVVVALFDYIWEDSQINKDSLEYPIIVTLIKNGILPVTSEGYPIKIEL